MPKESAETVSKLATQVSRGPAGDRTETAVTDADDAIDVRARSGRAESSVRYTVLEEQGRGGIGRVMRARDHDLDRDIAIKELLRPSATAEARFLREAKITARLQHPGIVPIYESGRWPDGSPYYAMKMVSGRTLKECIEEAATTRERLALLSNVLAVADAVAYAHSKGIIHRDLKPSNVIVGEFGETLLIDWGLARDLSAIDRDVLAGAYRVPASISVTRTGAVIGTPAYMAPEQARGEEVDRRADVYGLGAILYHVLTGATAVSESDTARSMSSLREGTGVRIEDDTVPPELRSIVHRAMRPDRADRYTDAGELATELRDFQKGNLVSAHQYTPSEVLRRWARKYRGFLASAGVALAVVAVVLAASFQRVIEERDRTEHQRNRAESALEKARAERERLILLQAEREPSRSTLLRPQPGSSTMAVVSECELPRSPRELWQWGLPIVYFGLMDEGYATLVSVQTAASSLRRPRMHSFIGLPVNQWGNLLPPWPVVWRSRSTTMVASPTSPTNRSLSSQI